jgi:hypothetical protein
VPDRAGSVQAKRLRGQDAADVMQRSEAPRQAITAAGHVTGQRDSKRTPSFERIALTWKHLFRVRVRLPCCVPRRARNRAA